MTIVALCRSGQVIEVFARSRNAIMTTAAATQYLKVVDRYYRVPKVGAMTILTDVGGCDVIE